MFTNLLIHELDVYRRSGATDRLGQPVDSNPSIVGPLTATYPCRLSSGSGGGRGRGGRINDERSLDVFAVNYKVFVMPDVDVREDDTVVVRDPRTGFELSPKAKVFLKSVISDGNDVHHIELDCTVQRGPQ